jgi:hypothetical protein
MPTRFHINIYKYNVNIFRSYILLYILKIFIYFLILLQLYRILFCTKSFAYIKRFMYVILEKILCSNTCKHFLFECEEHDIKKRMK